MKMPASEYNDLIKVIRDWKGDKESLQRLYDDIYYKYEDAKDNLYYLDKYQTKWTMNLHQ